MILSFLFIEIVIYIYIYIVYCHENTQDVNFHVLFRKVGFLHKFLYRGSLSARWTTPKKCESFLTCSSLKFWASKFNIRFPKLFLDLSDDAKRVWGCTPCLLMHSFLVQIMRMFFKHWKKKIKKKTKTFKSVEIISNRHCKQYTGRN